MINIQINRLLRVTEDTLCLYFIPDKPLVYTPGQYISLVLSVNGRELRRPYSLSSYAPVDPMPFITVKRVENGEVTRYLHQQVKPGDVMMAMEPNGRFTLPAPHPSQLFFMAAGSGISPVIALIKHALYSGNSQVFLLYSNRSVESTIFYTELLALQELFADRFTIVWFFSNHKNLMQARLTRTFLETFVKSRVEHQDRVLFYTCGPFYYMEMIFITLITMGYKEEQLYKETFALPEEEEEDDGSLIADENAPEYVDATVTLELNGAEHSFLLKAGDSILDAALRNHIRMPYSCRSGMCSTCTGQLNQGEVYMHYNQVLTDREVEQGRILTCTAHPVSRLVRVKIG